MMPFLRLTLLCEPGALLRQPSTLAQRGPKRRHLFEHLEIGVEFDGARQLAQRGLIVTDRGVHNGQMQPDLGSGGSIR